MSTFPRLQPASPLHSDHAQENQYNTQARGLRLSSSFFFAYEPRHQSETVTVHCVPHQPPTPIMPAGLLTQTLICLVSDYSLLPVCRPWLLLSSPRSALNCQPNHIFPSHKILQWFLLPVE